MLNLLSEPDFIHILIKFSSSSSLCSCPHCCLSADVTSKQKLYKNKKPKSLSVLTYF